MASVVNHHSEGCLIIGTIPLGKYGGGVCKKDKCIEGDYKIFQSALLDLKPNSLKIIRILNNTQSI